MFGVIWGRVVWGCLRLFRCVKDFQVLLKLVKDRLGLFGLIEGRFVSFDPSSSFFGWPTIVPGEEIVFLLSALPCAASLA